MTVHYNPASLANTLYLKNVASSNYVTVKIDTSKEHAITVFLPNGSSLLIKECNDRLYHLNINILTIMLCLIHVYKLVIKSKQISNAGKLWEQKNPYFTT